MARNPEHENNLWLPEDSSILNLESIKQFREQIEKIDADLGSKIDALTTKEDVSELMQEVELKIKQDSHREIYKDLYNSLEKEFKQELYRLKKQVELEKHFPLPKKENKSYLTHNTFLSRYEQAPLGENIARDIGVATLAFMIEFVSIIQQLGITLAMDLINLPRDIQKYTSSWS